MDESNVRIFLLFRQTLRIYMLKAYLIWKIDRNDDSLFSGFTQT